MPAEKYEAWLRRKILASDGRGNFTHPVCDAAELRAWIDSQERKRIESEQKKGKKKRKNGKGKRQPGRLRRTSVQ
jgi:hypothetical protein